MQPLANKLCLLSRHPTGVVELIDIRHSLTRSLLQRIEKDDCCGRLGGLVWFGLA